MKDDTRDLGIFAGAGCAALVVGIVFYATIILMIAVALRWVMSG